MLFPYKRGIKITKNLFLGLKVKKRNCLKFTVIIKIPHYLEMPNVAKLNFDHKNREIKIIETF